MYFYPIKYWLPGKNDSNFVVTAQQRNVRMAIMGISKPTGNSGAATSPPIRHRAIGAKKKRCIRYIPNERRDSDVMIAHGRSMQLKSKKAPKVANNTLGVQNSHDHSSIGVSMSCPRTPFHQKLHAVKAAPNTKQIVPMFNRFLRVQ